MHRWEDIIKRNLRGTEHEDVEWIKLAQDTNFRRYQECD